MAGKKEFSAGVVKALKSFFQLFSVPDSECGQSVESWSWRSNNMVRGLISERSYPWAVEPAGLRPEYLYHRPPSPAQQPITDYLNEMFRQQGR